MGAGRRPSRLGQYGIRRRLRAVPTWLGAALRGAGPERDVLVQAAKTALAATLAWVIAEHWLNLPQSFLAPYAAMFMVSATVYRSVTGALQQVAAVGLGLVLAFVVVRLVGPELAALAVMVAVGVLLGRWRGFGENGQWVAATALLVFTYGMAADPTMLGIRLAETAGGAALGALINILILPPVHLRDARTAIESLASAMADLLEEFAGTLHEGGWRSGQVDDWCHRVDGLDRRIRRAERAVSWQRESTRFNPRPRIGRRRRSEPVPPDLTSVLSTLRHLEYPLSELADIAPSVGDRDADPGPGSALAEPWGDAVAGVAEAVRHLADGGSCGTRTEECAVRRAVDRAHALAERLDDQPPRPRVWAGTGALLHAVDRMITQLEPHCQCERPDEAGRSPLVTRG